MSFLHDLSVALRSLARTKGLAVTVVLTLALGIGANAAIFSLVRGVLLRPLVNSDEERLIYIQQSAPGISRAAEASTSTLAPSSASSNPISHIPRTLKSLPTFSPAPIIFPRPCRMGAFIE